MYIKVDNEKELDKFNTDFKKGHWVVLYHADWCPACQMFKPVWNEYVQLNNNKNLNIADIEHAYMSGLNDSQDDLIGYPTVRYFYNSKKEDEFTGERTPDSLNDFSNDNVSRFLKKVKKLSKKKKTPKRKNKKKKSLKKKKN